MKNHRAFWVDTLEKIAWPVLSALSEGNLHKEMPVEFYGERDRRPFAHLEAFGRTLCGIAPWLEAEGLTPEEEEKRARYAAAALRGLDGATHPASPDRMNFSEGGQPLVDAAFLAHGLIRAPKRLIGAMGEELKKQVAAALRESRGILPGPNNWILFSAMVEAALFALGEPDADRLRVSYALRQFMQWYKGDGLYGDGAAFHADYYNSFVIQPMLVDVARTFAPQDAEIREMLPVIESRASRYAALLERLISPDGYYPITGRSICYRFGAFQMLSQAALERLLDPSLPPAQVRCALTAVIARIMQAPGNFDENGWLRIGVYGSQPSLAESYICTGSLYLCCAVFPALGLPPADSFWSGPDMKWTAQKVSTGEDFPCDHSIAG
ncbi:MAG: DUF2264 domain-containing protein [Provencibacterium sp.]|nr:DUF2264 domain-containing protein [Provencibacterium sp.]